MKILCQFLASKIPARLKLQKTYTCSSTTSIRIGDPFVEQFPLFNHIMLLSHRILNLSKFPFLSCEFLELEEIILTSTFFYKQLKFLNLLYNEVEYATSFIKNNTNSFLWFTRKNCVYVLPNIISYMICMNFLSNAWYLNDKALRRFTLQHICLTRMYTLY